MFLMRFSLLALVLPSLLSAGPGADLAKSIREIAFDRDQCYRIRDITFAKEDIRFYLTDGHIIFSKPIAGRPIAAMFTADGESGDGEIILLPPDRAERRSLSTFIHSPNLDDHFTAGIFLFTGSEYADLKEAMAQNPAVKKTPEVGALMDEQYAPILRDIAASYQTRLTFDLLGRPANEADFFAAVLNSPKLGNYDVSYDPDNIEQIVAGQVLSKDSHVYFDDWTSFRCASARKSPPVSKIDLEVSDYRIDAAIHPDLSMSAVTRVKVTPREGPLKAVKFEISPALTVTGAAIDGRAAEVLQPESERGSLVTRGNNLFLVFPPEPLVAGRTYEFEFHHEGKVILDAGDGVYYVAARGMWYPLHGLQFTTFDLTFRYPRNFEIVAPGDIVDDRTDGDTRVTRRRTSSTVRMAGFNLGDFAHTSATRGPYTVDVWANRKLEAALQPLPPPVIPEPAIPYRRSIDPLTAQPSAPPPPNPMARLQPLAAQIASALEFMASKLGPPALPHLAVSPIPGAFGQGFPGLIYLSTLSYLSHVPNSVALPKTADLFFEDMLEAHETAHQWWGNRITAESYRDYWLMEALANYCALLYVEKTKGSHAVDEMLESYRAALLEKNESGETKESAGPIVLGARLQSSVQPAAWTAITYGKGAWILHMLRARMGDERFLSMLSSLAKKYDHRTLTTDQFRLEAAAALPPKSEDPKLETFFDQWVYGTGIPSLKLTYSVKGSAPAVKLTGTLTQSGVDDDFSVYTPIEIRFARGPSITKWVASGGDPATFTMTLKQPPSKVTLDPRNQILRIR